jgi:Tfp pilus assembly PilM family ATPase
MVASDEFDSTLREAPIGGTQWGEGERKCPMRWFSPRLTPIGIDVGARCIKAVQLSPGRDRYRLQQSAVLPLAQPNLALDESGASIIKDALEKQGFSGRRIVLNRAEGTQLLDAFEAAGFRVEASEDPEVAVLRACESMLRRPGCCVVDIGWSCARVMLLRAGECVQKCDLTGFGVGSLHRAVREHFGLDAEVAEQLLREISLDLVRGMEGSESVHAAWARGLLMKRVEELAEELESLFEAAQENDAQMRVSRLVLVGGGAGVRGLDNDLRARLDVEVFVGRPFELADCDRAAADRFASPALTAAMGLAQWSASS